MIEKGSAIELTKGYKGVKGIIIEKTDSIYEFYVVKLDNGINIVVGPTAFNTDQNVGHNGII